MTCIAPEPVPERDQCGYCGHWYIVRDGQYGVCPHHAGTGSTSMFKGPEDP